jgi:hypothetical protein
VLPAYLHLALRVRISGAIPPHTLYAFVVWTVTTLSILHRNDIALVVNHKHILKERMPEKKTNVSEGGKNNIKMDVKI